MFNFLRKEKADLVSFKEWAEQASEETKYTPDSFILERRQYWLLFVPDELMSGRNKDYLLKDSSEKMPFLAFTNEWMSCWYKRAGDLSTVIPMRLDTRDAPLRRIRGELWKVPTKKLFELDTYRKNGVEFRRERVNLFLPISRLVKVKAATKTEDKLKMRGIYFEREQYASSDLNVWMYIGITEYWKDLLDGGFTFTPVQHFDKPHNPLLSEYYYFTNKEYDGNIREPRTLLRMRKL